MSGEAVTRFRCFGGDCAVFASAGGAEIAPEAVMRARRRMLEWHERFSRFVRDSELSRLNRDPREVVPVTGTMLVLVAAALQAARDSGGLIDPTVILALRAAGYARSRDDRNAPARLPVAEALRDGPVRRMPAAADPAGAWQAISIDSRTRCVVRPPGLQIDLGGIAKGVFGDLLSGALGQHDSFAVDAAGDVRFGGRDTPPRPIAVAAPEGGDILHTFRLASGAAATSGIGRRIWRDAEGRPAHHLIDPARGRPAFTGLVQATALAATGTQAEMRAKAALLSGPERATEWLPDGGVLVADDGTVTVLGASAALAGEPAVMA